MDTNKNPNVELVIGKLNQIYQLIQEIGQEDPFVGNVLTDFYVLSMNTMAEAGKSESYDKADISNYISVVSRILGVDVRDLVEQAVKDLMPQDNQMKEADPNTLEFITSDLDDYEKFIAQNKAKESLEFLSKEI